MHAHKVSRSKDAKDDHSIESLHSEAYMWLMYTVLTRRNLNITIIDSNTIQGVINEDMNHTIEHINVHLKYPRCAAQCNRNYIKFHMKNTLQNIASCRSYNLIL
jgi:hypothetical protein